VRRSAFLSVGGFDDVVRFPGEEERLTLDLASAGWLLSYVDDLVMHHHPSPSRGPAAQRQAQIVRSALLTATMRRPLPDAWGLASAGLRAGGPARAGVLSAVPRLPAALRNRRVISPALRRRLDRLAQLTVPA
jgi:hypothetical protein